MTEASVSPAAWVHEGATVQLAAGAQPWALVAHRGLMSRLVADGVAARAAAAGDRTLAP
ncbi:MAG: hypothetical protein H7290_13540 [Flavobacterium sp.]|nr:hypothetical protein [Aeromicrobium sp.]